MATDDDTPMTEEQRSDRRAKEMEAAIAYARETPGMEFLFQDEWFTVEMLADKLSIGKEAIRLAAARGDIEGAQPYGSKIGWRLHWKSIALWRYREHYAYFKKQA